MSRTFHSHFADDIREMVAYKTALGHKAASYEWNLQNFDRYCMKHYPDAVTLTKEIVFGWCQAAKGNGKSAYRANTIRNFGKYLTAIGKEAYVLPTEMFVSQKADLPYLFTDEELEHFLMLLTIIRTVATALYWNTSSLLFFDCNTYAGYAPRKCVC